VAGSYEYGSKPSGSVKFWEILEKLSDSWLLKKNSAAWSQLVSYTLRSIHVLLRRYQTQLTWDYKREKDHLY
jgi:hypothetical protein